MIEVWEDLFRLKESRGPKLSGFAFKRDGSHVETLDRSSICLPISQGLFRSLFREVADPGALQQLSGSNVALAGHPAIPDVCEASPASASLFAEEGTK